MQMQQKNIRYAQRAVSRREETASAYRDFDATELYCPRCKKAVPVRKRLLLVLPEGDKYEYRCSFCSATVGTKIDRQKSNDALII